ncbi:hypothetical protein C8A06_0413 [Microbacteriaceae bacterium MWH-Ta3]|nr:hypothetical protein C8A06_0413 [Microbacteriaceae bacterium MWH-Ta3]
MRFASAAAALAATALLVAPAASHAITETYGVDIYMSAPTVQGTAITNSVTVESFNLASTGACPESIAIGAVSGDCLVEVAGTYGGASADADDATPTTGGSGSNYASTSGPSTTITIDLTQPAKYLGLWWSAGSASNVVELYSGEDRVAYMTTSTLMSLLETGGVTSVGGTDYNTSDYYGNPRDNSLASAEPFLYLNLYGTGGASFDRIVLSGGGFEFDNIAVSDLAQVPGNGEVGVEFIAGENAPAAEEETEELAETGVNAGALFGFAVLAIAAGAVAMRRRVS